MQNKESLKDIKCFLFDMDGTINDSTKIYSMAGSKEKNPQMTTYDLERMAAEAGYEAVERDSFYNIITKKS